MTALLGNLSGLREWLVFRRPKHLPLDWHYFWATSRVVPNTVNEYPFWSFLFADLHAHVIAIPFFLLVAACALELVRAHADPYSRLRERLGSAVLLGFAAAAQALTNAWDAPLLAGLLVMIPVVLAAAPGLGLRAALRALISGAVSLGVVLAAAWPLWPRGGGPPGWGRNLEPPPPGIEVVNVFGLFFLSRARVVPRGERGAPRGNRPASLCPAARSPWSWARRRFSRPSDSSRRLLSAASASPRSSRPRSFSRSSRRTASRSGSPARPSS